MNQTVDITFKIDSDLKKDMEFICSEIGISMSTAFTIFAKKVAQENGIPFQLKIDDDFYSSNNIKHLEESILQMKQGKTVTKTFEELKKMENE